MVIQYTPDPRVNLTGVSLDYKVCFTSETPGAIFQGSVVYTAYLGGDAGTLFQEANKLAEGTKDVSGLSTGAVCVEGQLGLATVLPWRGQRRRGGP
ncbi:MULTISPECIES: hypothetical protein [unclassified Synechococcus]|uniref:hypothetical protein n=3 Tax=Synechococcus TaxID=1129 RepID=UPI0039C2A032